MLLSQLYQKQNHRAWAGDSDGLSIALAIVVVLLNLIMPQVAQSVLNQPPTWQTYLTSLNSLVQTLSADLDWRRGPG